MSISNDMPPGVERMLIGLALASPEREICGFIMGGWEVTPIDNVAKDDYTFDMDPEQQLEIFATRRSEIVGVYHSHPSGSEYPSDRDIYGAPRGMRYWIVTDKSVTEWVIDNGTATTTVAAAIHPTPEAV
jgi:proteasome lid subunit RPN8/RPN11